MIYECVVSQMQFKEPLIIAYKELILTKWRHVGLPAVAALVGKSCSQLYVQVIWARRDKLRDLAQPIPVLGLARTLAVDCMEITAAAKLCQADMLPTTGATSLARPVPQPPRIADRSGTEDSESVRVGISLHCSALQAAKCVGSFAPGHHPQTCARQLPSGAT
jgi:hypothetical protein